MRGLGSVSRFHSIDSGEKLITDHPVPGVPSITTDEGMKLCWG